jgi:hypothetical protein
MTEKNSDPRITFFKGIARDWIDDEWM